MENQPGAVKQQIKMIVLFLLGTIVVDAIAFAQNDNTVKPGITTGRLESILITLLGLASLILSIRQFRSSKKPASANKQKRIIIAGLTGLACMILAGIHIANSTGGFGTGSGKAGAIVAMILGLVALVLCGLSLNRFRHAS